MEQKKSKKGLLIVLAAVVVVLIAAISIYAATRPGASAESKIITVQVVHADGSTKDFKLTTEEDFLGRALVEGGVVVDNQSQYGLYIVTVDGETVDESKQEWWLVSKDGESLMVGADSQAIADGEHYELAFTVGYES